MDENGIKGLEEERRLAYVGLTRARKRAFVSFAANRRMYGQWVNNIPSRFVDELPPEHIEMTSEIMQAGRSAHWDSSGFTPKTKPKSQTFDRKTRSADGTIYARGDRVFHDKFGYGKIINIDGHKLDIVFETGGKKRVMDSFCLLYTSPSPRDQRGSRMPSSA